MLLFWIDTEYYVCYRYPFVLTTDMHSSPVWSLSSRSISHNRRPLPTNGTVRTWSPGHNMHQMTSMRNATLFSLLISFFTVAKEHDKIVHTTKSIKWDQWRHWRGTVIKRQINIRKFNCHSFSKLIEIYKQNFMQHD